MFALFTVFALFSSVVFAQCPTANVVLTTQTEVDNFADNYPNCTALTLELRIDGSANTITNLNGLSEIISGQKIFVFNTQVADFSGLDNLENIQHLALWGNGNIQDLMGFNSLQSIGFLEVFVNPNLSSLNGMPSLSSLDNLSLFQNTNLADMSQLSFVETLTNVEIWANGLNNLSGLENLQTVEGYIKISNEPLTNFNDLASLQTINGSLYLQDNPQAVDFSAFSNITTLHDLYIIGCSSMTDLFGFAGLQTITGSFRIGSNSGLIDLAGLNDLSSVEYFDIYNNENFLSLKGIENLDFIGQRVLIDDNESLRSVETLNYVSPSQVNEVVIMNNPLLVSCKNNFVCGIISDPSVSKTIVNNASDCNTVGDVEATCTQPISTLGYDNSVDVYPNPVSDVLILDVPEDTIFENALLYSISGEQFFYNSNTSINFSDFPEGVYFLTIYTSKGSFTKKIIKD